MSPNSPVVRPVWVWSIPAVAILISFFWFRKKRGLLQTDTGGPGETRGALKETSIEETPDCQLSVNNSVNSSVVESFAENNNKVPKEIESDVEEPPINLEDIDKEVAVEEPSIKKEEEKEEQIVEKVVEADTVEQVEETEPQLDNPPPVIEEEIIISENKIELETVRAIEELAPADSEEKIEEVNFEVTEVATPKDTPKASEPKKEEPGSSGPTFKWVKKKRMRKSGVPSNIDSVMSNEISETNGQKESVIDQKLANLKLTEDKEVNKTPISQKITVADGAERDSANNSPSEIMLASPSLSGYSDTHSEGSSDSGKGCSEVLTPSPTPVSGNSVSGDVPSICIYEFVIPQHLVGRLIGRNGSYIHEIKENTHASVYIKRHPETTKLKICVVEGTQVDIDSALDMIRQKFPKKRYPNVTLEPVELPKEIQPAVLPENIHLYLVEGINNDVILSSLISAGHFFLQQPTHPTYLSLNRLNSCMTACYAEPNLPALPDDISGGVLCAAPVHNGWYRAEVTTYPEGDHCCIKFVDYGGYMTIPKASLRQIRADFVTLPFQAAECFLADVQPIGEDGVWSEEAKEFVEKLTLGNVLQAQVHGYTDLSVPLIYLFTVFNNEVVCINEELVANGFAEWLHPTPVTEEFVSFVEAVNPSPVAV